MKSLTSWLLIMFMGMFWAFRVAVTLAAQYGVDLGGIIVFNNTLEIVLLFVSILCFILIAKRIFWGSVIYLAGYIVYFGTYLINNFIPVITSGEQIDPVVLLNSFFAIIPIVLGLMSLLNIAFERTKSKHFSDNKTDWYFDNEKYDRKLDERADKKQYRTL